MIKANDLKLLEIFVIMLVVLFLFWFVKDESVPYTFFVNETEITGNLKETLESQTLETEKVVEIVYQPQAVFKVRAVTRCTSTIPGEALINLNVCVWCSLWS